MPIPRPFAKNTECRESLRATDKNHHCLRRNKNSHFTAYEKTFENEKLVLKLVSQNGKTKRFLVRFQFVQNKSCFKETNYRERENLFTQWQRFAYNCEWIMKDLSYSYSTIFGWCFEVSQILYLPVAHLTFWSVTRFGKICPLSQSFWCLIKDLFNIWPKNEHTLRILICL